MASSSLGPIQVQTHIEIEPHPSHHSPPSYPPLPPPTLLPVPSTSSVQPPADTHDPHIDDNDDCARLYQAALTGDKKTALEIIRNKPRLESALISPGMKETVLHVATSANHTEFVSALLKVLKVETLCIENESGHTALSFATMCGNVRLVTEMLKMANYKQLLSKSDKHKKTPLYMAMLSGNKDMVNLLLNDKYLAELSTSDIFELLDSAIYSDLYDAAKYILEKKPELAIYGDSVDNTSSGESVNGKSVLKALARKHSKANSIHDGIWTTCLKRLCWRNNENKNSIKSVHKDWGQIQENYRKITNDSKLSSEFLFDATEAGDVELVKILIKDNRDLIRKPNGSDISIFHVAVANRHVEIFNLIHELGPLKYALTTLKDGNHNNLLHLAAMKPPAASLEGISGAALQMQREVLWYKAVEKVVPPKYREMTNSGNKTPISLFKDNHEELRLKGEKWMKTTANSCSLVAALITTIVFTVAFTLPGGTEQNTGTPISQREAAFVVFAIADAISFFLSSIAILMFLGILTSRYAYEDFLTSLPVRFMVGMSSLFFSIAFMMVAFASAFFITFKVSDHNKGWISIPIVVAVLAAVPVVLFASGQFRLLIDVFSSTREARHFLLSNEKMLRGVKNKSI